MRQVAIFLLLGATSPGWANDQIVLLVINGRNSSIKNTRYLELFEIYNLTDRLRVSGQLRNWTADRFGAYRDRNSQHGHVYTLGENGAWNTVGFATLKNPAAFDRFVADKVKTLNTQVPEGTEPDVTRLGDRWTIRTPAFTWNDGSGFSSPEWEQHYRYLNPVMVSSSGPASLARLRALPLREMADLLKPALGKISYVRFQPGDVSMAIKLAALRTIAREVAPAFQQRDSETSEEYVDRRAVSETRLELVRSFLLDLEHLTASTEWPEGDRPYTVSCKVKAKNGSKLHELFKTLSSRTSQEISLGVGNVGGIQVATEIPQALTTVANAWLQKALAIDDVSVLQPGVCCFAGRLDFADDRVEFIASCRGGLADPTLKLLLRDRVITPKFRSISFSPWHYAALMTPSGINLSTSTQSRLLPPSDVKLKRSKSAVVARVFLDLAPLVQAKTVPQIRQLLRDIERSYTLAQRPLSDLDVFRGVKANDEPSLLDFAEPDGDWKLEGELRIRGSVAELRLTVGSAAHRFWRLHQLKLKI